MKRRHLLAGIGAGAACLAGCLGTDGTPDGTDGTPRPDGPAIDDQPCPPYETDRDRAVCSHTVETDDEPVSLTVDPERGSLSDGTTDDEHTLTLHNQSDMDLTFNPNSWRFRYDGGSGWRPLQAELAGDGHVTLQAGETRSWTFMEAVGTIQENPELEPGLYAAELGVPDPDGDDEWLACLALCRLV